MVGSHPKSEAPLPDMMIIVEYNWIYSIWLGILIPKPFPETLTNKMQFYRSVKVKGTWASCLLN